METRTFVFFGRDGKYSEATFALHNDQWFLVNEQGGRSFYASIGWGWDAWIEGVDSEDDWHQDSQQFGSWDELTPIDQYDGFKYCAFWHENHTPLPDGYETLQNVYDKLFEVSEPDHSGGNGAFYRLKDGYKPMGKPTAQLATA